LKRLDAVAAFGCILASAATSASATAEPTKQQCIAAINTGEDLRHAGKLLEAQSQFEVCVAASCWDTLRTDCGKRLADTVAAIPTLVFDVKDGGGNAIPSVRVSVDGAPLTDRLDGSALRVDPGEHKLVFEDTGHGTQVETVLAAREGEKDRHVSVIIVSPTVKAPSPVSETARPSEGTSRMPALVVGATGVVGVGVGIATDIAAMSKHSTLAHECRSPTECPTDAQSDLDAFHLLRTASAVAYVVGALGIAGGITLWLVSRSHSAKGPATSGLWISPGSVWVGTRF
jgi:hypothetical protein